MFLAPAKCISSSVVAASHDERKIAALWWSGVLVTAIQGMIYCSVLKAGQAQSVLTCHEVALHRFQTSLKDLSTLPPIFSFKKQSEWGFAQVGYAKENKTLLGTGGSGPLALELITGCPIPAADSTVGNFGGFFFLLCSGLAHQRNVRRENIENMTHMLLKQIKQRALLASGWPKGLVPSTSGPPAASALHMWPRLCFSTPLHGGQLRMCQMGCSPEPSTTALVSPGPGQTRSHFFKCAWTYGVIRGDSSGLQHLQAQPTLPWKQGENEIGEAWTSLQSEAPSCEAWDQTLVLVSQAAEVLYSVPVNHHSAMPFHGGCWEWMAHHFFKMHVLLSCASCFGAERGMMKEERFYWLAWAWEGHIFTSHCQWSACCLPAHHHSSLPCVCLKSTSAATGDRMRKQGPKVIWVHDNFSCPLKGWLIRQMRLEESQKKNTSWGKGLEARKKAKYCGFWDPRGRWLPEKEQAFPLFISLHFRQSELCLAYSQREPASHSKLPTSFTPLSHSI